MQGSDFAGTFKEFSGTINFAADNLAGSRADIKILTKSVQTGSPDRDDYIAAPAWMDAESFPESEFVADRFEKTAENQYVAHGRLTMRGVTHNADLPFTLKISENKQGAKQAEMNGALTINRLDYGIGGGEWTNTTLVANPVKITVFVVAHTN